MERSYLTSMPKRYRTIGLLCIMSMIFTYFWLGYSGTLTSYPERAPGLQNEDMKTFSSHAVNKTVAIVPVNSGMLHWAENLLCSLSSTSFNSSNIVFWALDPDAQTTLAAKGHATYRNPSLFATSVNENEHGDTTAYKRMMRERPKFYFDILSAGFDILMLDADTVFWQSPLSIIPHEDDHSDVDIVFSTDAREFYQAHDAFLDDRRRGPYIPPVCNGIFWMKSNSATISLWSEMLYIFESQWLFSSFQRKKFQDDQRGMDVLLNDGRAQLVEPLPEGITPDMVPSSPQTTPARNVNVRLLDQTLVINGHLLKNRPDAYEDNLLRLEKKGKERIAAHFNWDTREISKEDGARAMGLLFTDGNGACNATSGS